MIFKATKIKHTIYFDINYHYKYLQSSILIHYFYKNLYGEVVLIPSKVKKFSYIYFLLLILGTIYIYISKEDLKNNINDEIYKDIKQKYKIYKKAYKSSTKLKSLLIKNENYIDYSEMVDELSKSSPFLIHKKEKMVHKFDITFNFFDKKDENKIKEYIKKLSSDEYFIEYEKTQINLFGKVYEDGYILITKNFEKDKDFNNTIDLLSLKLFLFAIINMIVLLYLINLIKHQKFDAKKLMIEFELLKDDTKKMAFEDTLTKAASRLKFDETLKDLIQIASRFEQNRFGVIMFDIDNFKKLNDSQGHDFGDYVLKNVSKSVKDNIRGSDTFARWGGEEFVVLSPMNDLEQTLVLAEKLRSSIENIPFPKIDKVTCSFGVVIYEDGEDSDMIMKRVDKLLYKAKKNGKNRVEYK